MNNKVCGYQNYDKYPEKCISTSNKDAVNGYQAICQTIKRRAEGKEKTVVAVDCYPGVDIYEITEGFRQLDAAYTFQSADAYISDQAYQKKIEDNLTEDPVFGIMTCNRLENYLDAPALKTMRAQIESAEHGIILIIGVGASLIRQPDILIYADIARWEIETRMKNGMSNWKTQNADTVFTKKFKQGYFVEWRLGDRHKKHLLSDLDFYIDTNEQGQPKMIAGNNFRRTLETFSKEPFRLVPYFDPGVWGGQWMKEVCDLDREKPNYAWSFDGVPEENSLYARFGDTRIEFPAANVVLYRPAVLLGDRVHARFGTEFPIRFDFLDTMAGENLSLQVHPLTEYIQETFGVHYTQDESYYILDAEPDAQVYLGLKENIDSKAMIRDLYKAQKGGACFPAEKYINQFPAKKHDHFLIPAGTVHCSGTGAMVLEISATPYIFTFKLWDWDRVGLDGNPRPIHISHGEKNIVWERTTPWVKDNLVNRFRELPSPEGVKAESTGLHGREFIETVRHTSAEIVHHDTMNSVNMLNLVEGAEAVVESPGGEFAPFVVHYAETFIIPESVKQYTIRPYGKAEGQTITTMKAYVRT